MASTVPIIQDLLGEAGIQINGSNPWDITVYNEEFYPQLLKNADLALGETYMKSWWDCQHLDQFFYRIFSFNLNDKALHNPIFWRYTLKHKVFEEFHALFNLQTKTDAETVGKIHYDIGNDLYERMLDKRMIYSCAYWQGAKNLDKAQENKLDLICRKLGIKKGMRILDIGCGWGGFAKYIAEEYDVKVVGTTISKQQFEFAKKSCANLPIEIRFQDYRDLENSQEKFDRVVSIGMFEHVGFKNYAKYMKIVSGILKEEGLFLLHTIGRNVSTAATSEWLNTYIFPNGQLPSIQQIGSAIEGHFVMEDWHNFGIEYDKTLMTWHRNLDFHWDELKNIYDDRLKRMFDYYLLSCAANFRARQNQLWQIVLSKHGVKSGYQRTS